MLRFASSTTCCAQIQEMPTMFGRSSSRWLLQSKDRHTNNSLALRLLHSCCHTICTRSKSPRWSHTSKTCVPRILRDALRSISMSSTALRICQTSFLSRTSANKTSRLNGLQPSVICSKFHLRRSWLFISQMILTTPILG